MQKKWLFGGVAAAVVVLGAGGAWMGGVFQPKAEAATQAAAKKDGKDGKPEVALEFIAREVVQPSMARIPGRIEFSGPLVAPQTAVVRAKAAGTLLALTVEEGSRVAAGQTLARVDLAELSSRVAERSANLESAKATLAQAERTHASNERLAAQQFISPIALENSRAAVDTARASLAAMQAALETSKVSLRDAALVAPISGIVAKRHAVPGEKLSAEQQVLSIVDIQKLELAGAVGTHEVSRLAPGMAVQVAVEGVAQPVTGRIARIAPAAEPGTRSIGVTIELPNPKETLRAGQYAVARALLPDDADRMTVPVAAIGNTGGQDHVWVIENGTLARRAITLGRRDEREGRVEVLGGLTAVSQVLAARFDNLREGAKASVVASKSSAVASAAASTPQVR
ncbi:MAG: efflux RND transporter periplasmic adaptor subunit [Rubrivivax sp.]